MYSIRPHGLPCFIQNSPCWTPGPCNLTALAVALVCVGLITTFYFSCGLTPFIHQIDLFHPLKACNFTQLIVGIFTGVVLIGGGIGIGTCAPITPSKPVIAEGVLEELDQLAAQHRLPPSSVNPVKHFLTHYFTHSSAIYNFYFHLSTLTVYFLSLQDRASWRSFLEKIDRTVVPGPSYYVEHTIDCQNEYGRLEGGLAEDFLCEEWQKESSPTYPSDLIALKQIHQEAFNEGGVENDESSFINEDEVIIVRQVHSRALCACVFVRKIETQNGERALYAHSLARKASAVKWGLTQKMWEHAFQNRKWSQYRKIYCEVLLDNDPALRLYEKMGFRIVSTLEHQYVMLYAR